MEFHKRGGFLAIIQGKFPPTHHPGTLSLPVAREAGVHPHPRVPAAPSSGVLALGQAPFLTGVPPRIGASPLLCRGIGREIWDEARAAAWKEPGGCSWGGLEGGKRIFGDGWVSVSDGLWRARAEEEICRRDGEMVRERGEGLDRECGGGQEPHPGLCHRALGNSLLTWSS